MELLHNLKERYDKLYNSAIVKKSNVELLIQQLADEEAKVAELHEDLKALLVSQQTYEQAIDILKKMMDGLSKTQIQHLSDLLNSAVSSIFFDQKYSIELKVEEYRNTNTLNILLHDLKDNGDEVVSDMDSNGFGLKAIIGFILQVYFILYYKQSPVLFLDEAFTYLSSQYLPYLKSLIVSLTNKYSFIFVLITHDERLMELADKSYIVRQGEVKLQNA